jgi:hypothetical protein
MEHFRPLPFTVYPKKSKILLLLLMSMGFVAGGTWMIHEGDGWGWAPAAIFAVCIFVFVIQLLPGSAFLTVDDLGIEFCALFRKQRYGWSDISEFGTYTIRNHGMAAGKFVGINFSPTYQGASRGRAMAKAMTGFEGALPDTYGYKAEELAELLAFHHAQRSARRAYVHVR